MSVCVKCWVYESVKGKMGVVEGETRVHIWRERWVCVCVCVWRLGCVCEEVVEEGDMFGWMRKKLRGCERRFQWRCKRKRQACDFLCMWRDGCICLCVCECRG